MRGADHVDVRVVAQRLIALTAHPDFAATPLPVAVAAAWRGWKVVGSAETGDAAAFALRRGETWAAVRVDLAHSEVDYSWAHAPVRGRLAVLAEAFRDAVLGNFLDVLDEVSRPNEQDPIPHHLVTVRALLAGPVPHEAMMLLALGGFHDVARTLSEESQSWTAAFEMPELATEVRHVVEDWGVRRGWPGEVVESVAAREIEAAVRHMEDWLRGRAAAGGGLGALTGLASLGGLSGLDGGAVREAWVKERDRYLTGLVPPGEGTLP